MKKKLIYNTASSLIFQVTTIICGFILPRLILGAFGSNVNGLVNSITQFLGIISFLELGVGAVVQSALYKPLAENRQNDVSKIISSANKFFRRLAQILTLYVVVLVIFYPMLAAKEYGFWYTATLIVAISISSFAQYYFGIVNRLLLTADQRGYVQYTAQTIAVVGNTIACYILIMLGCGIQVVKLTTSLIYLIQPFAIYLYVRKHYQIDTKIKYDTEPIPQKWNGIAQHIAAVILDGTDTVVLTLFATLADVSIYSVYFQVVRGVKQLILSMTNGIQSLMGELWAKQETEELRDFFGWVEWGIHTGVVFSFGCMLALILPFVSIYTNGITDTNYTQPLFAILLVAANACHCLRIPYSIMILAGGHYKQTQSNYIIAAALNLGLSILLVNYAGLIGVACGTLVAMLYQTIWMAYYDSKDLIQWPFKNFVKQCLVDVLSFGVIMLGSNLMNLAADNYLEWAVCAIEVALLVAVVVVVINEIFYRDKINHLIKKILKMVKLNAK